MLLSNCCSVRSDCPCGLFGAPGGPSIPIVPRVVRAGTAGMGRAQSSSQSRSWISPAAGESKQGCSPRCRGCCERGTSHFTPASFSRASFFRVDSSGHCVPLETRVSAGELLFALFFCKLTVNCGH